MKEKEYKGLIAEHLRNTLDSGYLPELGRHRKGKVRDIHLAKEAVGEPIIMVASDRVSAFDHVLDRRIPFKGMILNLFNEWAFRKSEDIVANASVASPHPNVVVQRYCRNLMIECVVRGHLWGSLAGQYERGERSLYGLTLPDGLLRYQELEEPLFTPTTKGEEHDEPMTYAQVEELLGEEKAAKVKEVSIRLFRRARELAKERGLLFIDTKYEFGEDEKGELLLIDEANTPDSSRYCTVEEYAKFARIEKEMKSGSWEDVGALLKERPELKIKELSKQFVRDVLIEKGFSYGSTGEIPSLTDEDVIEVSWRYIRLYETLTGETFAFPGGNVRQELLARLRATGHLRGGLAVVWAGSDSDREHMERLKGELEKRAIPCRLRICSAHKQPAKAEAMIREYNQSLEPVVFITVAGGTDALSGLVSYHSVHPVISCPPDPERYESTIANPPGSSNSVILRPANAARHVAQILGGHNREWHERLLEENATKKAKLEKADGEQG